MDTEVFDVETKSPPFVVASFSALSRETLERKLASYLGDYSPMGYATTFDEHPRQEHGVWKARLRRYSTCE